MESHRQVQERTRSGIPATLVVPPSTASFAQSRLLSVNTMPSAAGSVSPSVVGRSRKMLDSTGFELDYSDDFDRSTATTPYQETGTPGGSKVGTRNYYNPARHSVYTRYSTNDWLNHGKAYQHQSHREQLAAVNRRTDAWLALKCTDQKTRSRQVEASKKLSDRVLVIEGHEKLLEKEVELNGAETARIVEVLRQLENSLAHTANPLLVAEECLLHREKRLGIDLVKDEVERQLSKEVECIRKCQSQMGRLVEKARDQMRQNRAALHELDKDLRNKSHARSIDNRLSQLQNRSPGIAFYPGIEEVDASLTIPDSWARFSQENVARSKKCRTASEKLRAAIEALMRGCSNEMWSQFNAVNGAFSVRIREIMEARNSLQCQLQRTLAEIQEAEGFVNQLRKGIADKEAPMKVAHTRLEERNRRVNVELCNDVATATLQREVQEIRDSQRTLAKRLKSLEESLSRLNRTRSNLEADIRVKEMSLHIDAKCCMWIRKNFAKDAKPGVNFSSFLQ